MAISMALKILKGHLNLNLSLLVERASFLAFFLAFVLVFLFAFFVSANFFIWSDIKS